jgi:DNA-3-methyladenine glycosylase
MDQIRPLGRAFYVRDPRRVARELLGKVLIRQEVAEKVRRGGSNNTNGSKTDRRLTARIVEVEAYLGKNDPAAHAAAGKTARNSVLFGPPGYAYIYFIYGNHYCLNVSCKQEGQGAGVLFRAVEPLSGIEALARARGIEISGPRDLAKLTSGPGRLAEAFGITRDRDNGCDLTSPASGLWIGDDGYRARGIVITPRIGITKAADRPLRYLLRGNSFVSGPKIRALVPARSSASVPLAKRAGSRQIRPLRPIPGP